jgi:predicted enzyme related to lactoylglutathione lyase
VTAFSGWNIEDVEGMGMDYMIIDIHGFPGGGMMDRMQPDQQITDYFGVASVDEYSAKVEKLGASQSSKEGSP